MLMPMSAGSGWIVSVRRSAPYLATGFIFLLIFAGLSLSKRGDPRDFWDTRVYTTAIEHYRAGVNPYTLPPDGMAFVYPPVFLEAGAVLERVIPSWLGWSIYLSLLCLAMCAIPWALVTAYVRSAWITPLMVCVLFVFQPKLFAEAALMTGNVATPLYAAILLAAIPGLRRNQWTLFYVAVAIASLIKLPFLSLLVLSCLAGTGQIFKSAVSAVIVLVGYAAEWIADRQLFLDYVRSVRRQVLDGGDAGLGVLAMLLKAESRVSAMHGAVAVVACAVIIAGMLGALSVLSRFRELPGIAEIWVPAALVAAILSNPRMMSYDANIAIVPGIFLFVQWARSLPATPYRGVWIAAPPAILLVVFSIGPATGIFLLIFGSLMLVFVQILVASRRALRSGGSVGPQRLQSAA
jgi:hypothetical protein